MSVSRKRTTLLIGVVGGEIGTRSAERFSLHLTGDEALCDRAVPALAMALLRIPQATLAILGLMVRSRYFLLDLLLSITDSAKWRCARAFLKKGLCPASRIVGGPGCSVRSVAPAAEAPLFCTVSVPPADLKFPRPSSTRLGGCRHSVRTCQLLPFEKSRHTPSFTKQTWILGSSISPGKLFPPWA